MSEIVSDMKRLPYLLLATLFCSCLSQEGTFTDTPGAAKLIALAPADDQIALVQYHMDSIFDRTVHVFASEGAYLDSYLASIERFNTRPDSATSWNEVVESEGNPLELLLAKQPGNIVLLSGRTATAAQYLFPCTEAGLNTLTSAPLAANTADFNKLRQATELADKQETLIGELTPERYEIASMLQRALARTPEFYGIQLCGSADEPSVRSENVLPLLPIQPKNDAASSDSFPADTYDSWSYPFDTLGMRYAFLLAAAPQIDLIQLALLGRERINYERQIRFISAQRTPIAISKQEYLKATATSTLPAALTSQLTGDTLRLPGNGQLTYILNGVHTALNIRYYLPAVSGNALASAKTNSAIEPSTTVSAGIPTTVSLPYRKLTLRGEKAILTLVEEPTNYPQLYVEPTQGIDSAQFNRSLQAALTQLGELAQGVTLTPIGNGYRIEIPDSARITFPARVTQSSLQYIDYMIQGFIPYWETDHLLAKYYTLIRPFDEVH